MAKTKLITKRPVGWKMKFTIAALAHNLFLPATPHTHWALLLHCYCTATTALLLLHCYYCTATTATTHQQQQQALSCYHCTPHQAHQDYTYTKHTTRGTPKPHRSRPLAHCLISKYISITQSTHLSLSLSLAHSGYGWLTSSAGFLELG